MSILSRLFRTRGGAASPATTEMDNAHHVVSPLGVSGGGFKPTDLISGIDGMQWVGNKRYADIVWYSLIEVVRSALSGIRWAVADSNNPLNAVRLRRLLTDNTAWLYKTLNMEGGCYLEYHDHTCRLLTLEDKDEADGLLVPITSNEMRWGLGSKYKQLKPMLEGLNVRMNADLTITEGLGALGILSPEAAGGGIPSLPQDERNRLQEDYNRSYGVTRGKWKMLITQKPVKYQPINLPIKDLELRAGIDHTIKMIAGYMRVPRELLPLAESATYANRSEAMRELRTVVVPDVCNNINDCLNAVLKPMGVDITWIDEATLNTNQQ